MKLTKQVYKLPVKYSKLKPKQRREVRLQYIEEQHNKCMYCKHSLDELPPKEITDKPITLSLYPKGFMDNPVHLQHSHVTDWTEGAVHAYCNAVLWEYEGR